MFSHHNGSTNPMPKSIYCLCWVGTSSELGSRRSRGGWRRRILGYHMSGTFFDCSEVVVVAKKSNKNNGIKKNRGGDKVNE